MELVLLKTFIEMKKPVSLIVLDGWGHSIETKDNAIATANTTYFDYLWKTFPHTLLEASGEAVGLPDGQMGNSEVGHITIGTGTVLDTDLVRINKAIRSGSFAKNDAFISAFNHVKKFNSRLHLMGLLSDGGVHSHQDHLFELLRVASMAGLRNIAVHIFTDGRDVGTTSSQQYLSQLEKLLTDLNCGFIATISGRYFAMDRDNNWDRLDETLKVIFDGKGNVCQMTPSNFVKDLHSAGISDEHIKPTIIQQEQSVITKIEHNDAIIFTNFRADRARMISEKILEKKNEYNLYFVTMTEYKKDFKAQVAFPTKTIETSLAEQISKAGLTQTHIAETEKFAHATYFLNGGKEKTHLKETHILLDSRKDVATHDLAPEMRAMDIAEQAEQVLKSGTDFLFVNIANPDMVGHTANVEAIIKAIETTDKATQQIVEATLKQGGIAIVTADHGNAETNREADGSLHTAHTNNLVPCIITDNTIKISSKGTLADLAPTVLQYLNIKQPKAMTGKSLIN